VDDGAGRAFGGRDVGAEEGVELLALLFVGEFARRVGGGQLLTLRRRGDGRPQFGDVAVAGGRPLDDLDVVGGQGEGLEPGFADAGDDLLITVT